MLSRTSPRPLPGLLLGLCALAGCWGGRPEGDLPPPQPATTADLDKAAADVEAGRPKGLTPRPNMPPPGAPGSQP